jgi:hypothetical protein
MLARKAEAAMKEKSFSKAAEAVGRQIRLELV